MKLQKLKAICKKQKMAYILNKVNEEGEILAQYVSDGTALYEIEDSLTLTKSALYAIWDISEKEREKWIIQEVLKDEKINCEWGLSDSKWVRKFGITIDLGGDDYIAILTSSGLVWLEESYFDPIQDEKPGWEIYERQTEEGKPYIVAMKGLVFLAAFIPVAEDVKMLLEEKLFDIATHVKKTRAGHEE